MNTIKNLFKKVGFFLLYWVWQFPQMAIGAILVKITNAKKIVFERSGGKNITYWKFERNTPFTKYISGVSLARFILLADNDTPITICHEAGHSICSIYLGWLYLLVIGLPSIINNLWDRTFHKNWNREDRIKWYYSRYPEKQADILGGVDRW